MVVKSNEGRFGAFPHRAAREGGVRKLAVVVACSAISRKNGQLSGIWGKGVLQNLPSLPLTLLPPLPPPSPPFFSYHSESALGICLTFRITGYDREAMSSSQESLSVWGHPEEEN